MADQAEAHSPTLGLVHRAKDLESHRAPNFIGPFARLFGAVGLDRPDHRHAEGSQYVHGGCTGHPARGQTGLRSVDFLVRQAAPGLVDVDVGQDWQCPARPRTPGRVTQGVGERSYRRLGIGVTRHGVPGRPQRGLAALDGLGALFCPEQADHHRLGQPRTGVERAGVSGGGGAVHGGDNGRGYLVCPPVDQRGREVGQDCIDFIAKRAGGRGPSRTCVRLPRRPSRWGCWRRRSGGRGQ